jgi:hypothetical protein
MWRWVVSFILRPLYAPSPRMLIALGTHWLQRSVWPRASLTAMEKRQISASSLESNPVYSYHNLHVILWNQFCAFKSHSFYIHANGAYLRSSVSIATGYEQNGRGSIPDRSKELLSPPQHQKRLWRPPGLLSIRYTGLVTRGKSSWGVKLSTRLLVPRSWMMEIYLLYPIRLHGVMIN